MLERDVAPGIHRVQDAFCNWYLVQDGSRVTIVDSGLPRSWASLLSALAELGRSPSDVDALVLTHAHYDHVGFAERARTEWHLPVWVHERDVSLSRHPLLYEHERPIAAYLRHVRALPILAAVIAAGAPLTKGLKEARGYSTEAILDVPGRPHPVFTPGHTHGHVALHFPERGVVIAGDAIVTLNPYTGRRGPQIVAGAATADSFENLASLARLADTGAEVVLTGHGEPWTGGVAAAVEQARERGPS